MYPAPTCEAFACGRVAICRVPWDHVRVFLVSKFPGDRKHRILGPLALCAGCENRLAVEGEIRAVFGKWMMTVFRGVAGSSTSFAVTGD